MNILLYCDDSVSGGTAVNAALLAEGFTLMGHPTILACGDKANPYASPDLPWAQLDYDPVRFPLKARLRRSEPEALFLRLRPDVVFFCDAAPDSSLAAKSVCRDWGIAYVVLVNYVPPVPTAAPAELSQQIGRSYAEALAVIAVSSHNLGLLRTRYGLSEQRSGVIYCGRPRHFFTPAPPGRREALRRSVGLGPDDVLCLTVARYEARKGYGHLLEAAARLAALPSGAPLRYVWIGHDATGEADLLAREAVARGLGGRIHILGQRDDVRDWLGAADIFVLPSESEGMPLSITEAMGQGLPVVATAVSGIPEQLGDTGLLLPDPLQDRPAMLAALTAALAGLAADPAGRRRLGEAARQRAATFFSAEAMLAGYGDALARLKPVIEATRPRYPDPEAGYQPPDALPLGRDILLGRDETSMEFLQNGWSHAEGEGRWTDGERAALTFRLPAGTWESYGLQLEAKPFLGRGDAPLTVRILFCGQELGCLRWPPLSGEKDRFDFAFFPAAPLPAVGELVFVIDGASSPLAHGLSDDVRNLGLWISRLRYDRLTPRHRP
jgi:glycosyltransferase involved in cell wall biosynthesis